MPETMGLRILLAVVGSSHSEAAVRLVANIPWPAGTSVHVLTVVPERWPYLGPSSEADARAGRSARRDAAGGLRSRRGGGGGCRSYPPGP